jgi:hypothetical protein
MTMMLRRIAGWHIVCMLRRRTRSVRERGHPIVAEIDNSDERRQFMLLLAMSDMP